MGGIPGQPVCTTQGFGQQTVFQGSAAHSSPTTAGYRTTDSSLRRQWSPLAGTCYSTLKSPAKSTTIFSSRKPDEKQVPAGTTLPRFPQHHLTGQPITVDLLSEYAIPPDVYHTSKLQLVIDVQDCTIFPGRYSPPRDQERSREDAAPVINYLTGRRPGAARMPSEPATDLTATYQDSAESPRLP